MRFIIFLAIILCSCRDNSTCPNYFILPINIKPTKAEFHVGDTITLISKFYKYVGSYNIEDKYLGKFNMEGVNWMPYINVFRTDTIDSPIPEKVLYSVVLKYFEFIPDTFNLSAPQFGDGNSIITGLYSYTKDTFNLMYKLVAKHPGIFLITHAGDENSAPFPGKCNLHTFYTIYTVNGGGDDNLDLLLKPNIPFWNEQYDDADEYLRKYGAYCFEVLP